ncbi:hypothetical protein [Gordonia amicalis]|uniref:hypothetical protein n=1 Tax=Gordonia amicalis TaxID=89053 RepID=UPI000688D84B|nr:hypothetical protein [Gordonia amicalis]
MRDRRRKRLTVVYGGGFDLATEVAEITGPLAEAIAHRSPTPTAHRIAVGGVADAVAEVVWVAVALLAESDADRRTRHLSNLSDRTRGRRMLIDKAQRPAVPEIRAEHLATGEWSAALTGYAAQVSDDLGALLGRALPPGQRRGPVTASERVVEALRQLDAAATAVGRSVERAISTQTTVSPTDVRSGMSADDELRAMGVEL